MRSIIDELSGGREPVGAFPVTHEQLTQGSQVLADVLGEDEDGFGHVAEVLVEGRRRRPHIPCDVDDAEVTDSRVLEQPRCRIQQPTPRERTTLPERSPVEGDGVSRYGHAR